MKWQQNSVTVVIQHAYKRLQLIFYAPRLLVGYRLTNDEKKPKHYEIINILKLIQGMN
jgi:hypothetical protein